MPLTLFAGEENQADRSIPWLRKPALSGGGHGIRLWDGSALNRTGYIQVLVPGVSASAVFAADGRQGVVLALSEQLIGKAALGARGFRHCGNIMPLAPALGATPDLLQTVQDMLNRLTRRFGLRGICGADFIISRDQHGCIVPVLLEINPRPSSSAELLEMTGRINIFDHHIRAVAGELPSFDPAGALGTGSGPYRAKGILFARGLSAIPEHLPDVGARLCDVGQPGDMVQPGRPICSLLVEGADRTTALKKLFTAASSLEQKLRIEETGPLTDTPPVHLQTGMHETP